MKYLAAVILLIGCSLTSLSQTYEIGGFLGGSNYIGDIGKTNYIAPNNLAFGGIFKWNRSARHSFRGTIILSDISGDDAESSEERRKQRGYSFKNSKCPKKSLSLAQIRDKQGGILIKGVFLTSIPLMWISPQWLKAPWTL